MSISIPHIVFITGIVIFASSCGQQPKEHAVTNQPSQVTSNPNPTPPPPPAETPTEPLNTEVSLDDGLRIKPHHVVLENKKLQYEISMTYPQVEGRIDAGLVKLNRWIKLRVIRTYQWPLSPSREDLSYYRKKWPEVSNSVEMDYQVVTANERLLSFYLSTYSYGIGAAHSVHESLTVNYDLKRRRILELQDLFRPDAKYLELISRQCLATLKRPYLQVEELAPAKNNFKSWNVTRAGLRFNFDACSIDGCSAGDLAVEIPFDELKHLLRSNTPLVP